ncbi:hypothetical protein C8R46DRAFT_1296775 [Mycena filopes]|nr:hypothetical protein C8R46DRAFT_1296775 [Mycena filopes]
MAPMRTPSPPPGPGGRPRRHRCLPARFRDELPDPPTVVPPSPIHMPEPDPEPNATPPPGPPKWVQTEPNAHGIYKVFPHHPTHDPDASISLDDLCRSSSLATPAPLVESTADTTAPNDPWFPFLNPTVARLMSWFHMGSNLKSISELDSLVNNPGKTNGSTTANAVPGAPPTGWINVSVKIKLPAPKVCVAEDDAAEFEIPGIIYRPLLDVMVEVFQGPAFEQFHITPFESRWDPGHDPDHPTVFKVDLNAPLDEITGLPPLPEEHQPLYGEIYTSYSMLREHNALPQTTPHLETIIVAYMFWSDSTHLANFGMASLWPLYTYFGNQSKYARGKPTANAGYHQAYFPSLPDSIKDFYRNLFGIAPSTDVLAHLKRELMHRIWDLLLTPEFIHAYVHGLVVKCYDGVRVERRIFPRFFTYSADYPEKVLLATIKYFGGCPCPRCFVQKDQISEMGTKADMNRRKTIREDTGWWRRKIDHVRTFIYEKGFLVAGAAVNRNLKPQSWVPTRNAFSKLADHGFNLFSMFVPDLLHEIELGVIKSLFVHIIRILYGVGGDCVAKLDERFRQIPTFGRSTIRRFHANVSEMKKMAARDFEDILYGGRSMYTLTAIILQCLIPALEGLLPEPHNSIVFGLVFTLATWHAQAKLRMHSASSIKAFRATTTELGASSRHFVRTTCQEYVAYELPKEETRRARRDAAKGTKRKSTVSAKKRKQWNISTYKYHSMGDYAETIIEIGTTDSYTTQTSECKHKEVKAAYARTNRRNFSRQIAMHERRKRLLRAINRRMLTASSTAAANAAGTEEAAGAPTAAAAPTPAACRAAAADRLQPRDEPLPRTPPRLHHHISESKRTWLDVHEFPSLPIFEDDPAVQNFLPQLKAHLLSRLLGLPYDGDETDFTAQDLLDVTIVQDRVYTHKVMRINYMTYDVQRDQDSINPRTNSDIMLLSREEDDGESTPHPYWYARVFGIFHANVRHVGEKSKSTKPTRMEFLWVRWFGRDLTHEAGWKARRLHRLGFLDHAGGGAFGAAHLIPAFHHGRTSSLLPKSIARRPDQNDEDWNYYYVNWFVDRDMFMRYRDDAMRHPTIKCGTLLPDAAHHDKMRHLERGTPPQMRHSHGCKPNIAEIAERRRCSSPSGEPPGASAADDEMDVDEEPTMAPPAEPDLEDDPVDGPDEDEDDSERDSDESEWENEPDGDEETEEPPEEGDGEPDAEGAGVEMDDEDIIDSLGYDAM